jgi:hypothetical protein
MENGSHDFVHGVGTVNLKFTSGKIVQLKNMSAAEERASCPFYQQEFRERFLLCRNGFKVV